MLSPDGSLFFRFHLFLVLLLQQIPHGRIVLLFTTTIELFKFHKKNT